MSGWLLLIANFAIVLIFAIPLGIYIERVMKGEPVFLSKVIRPIERLIYHFLGIDENKEMHAKTYVKHVLAVSIISFISLFIILVIQNTQVQEPMSLSAMFNVTSSYVTNTNWQSYTPELSMTGWVQTIGLGVQNFVSAAVGIAALFALIRGFILKSSATIGNFWKDFVRIILYILLPLSLLMGTVLVSQGVVQSIPKTVTYETTQDQVVESVELGLVASQEAIKQLGTNGGGYYQANSAHPYENPTAFSNLIETLSLVLIPAALCVTFGRMVKDKRQGRALLIVMSVVLIAAVSFIYLNESGMRLNSMTSIGNFEGKDLRFGIEGASIFSGYTTAASNGAVNSLHESYVPLSTMTQMFLMETGEVIFGGVGSGLYGMIGFAILTVFIGGLMVGKAPEYLRKKIEPREMKLVIIICLLPPFMILLSSILSGMLKEMKGIITGNSAHGFSQYLYGLSSTGGNNGSAMIGLITNTDGFNILTGTLMLIARFIPLVAAILLGGSLAKKQQVAVSSGTLITYGPLFIQLLLFMILLIGALSFLPALALGPIAEQLKGLGGF